MSLRFNNIEKVHCSSIFFLQRGNSKKSISLTKHLVYTCTSLFLIPGWQFLYYIYINMYIYRNWQIKCHTVLWNQTFMSQLKRVTCLMKRFYLIYTHSVCSFEEFCLISQIIQIQWTSSLYKFEKNWASKSWPRIHVSL